MIAVVNGLDHIDGLTEITDYEYALAAVDAAGNESAQSLINATTLSAGGGKPGGGASAGSSSGGGRRRGWWQCYYPAYIIRIHGFSNEFGCLK